jgi:hypothetical protein
MGRSKWFAALALVALLGAACGRDDDGGAAAPTTTAGDGSAREALFGAPDIADACESEPLEAGEVGVDEDTITVTVMADTGSPLAPGIFQGNVDAIVAFAEYVNERGGVGCRDLVVETWDSRFDPTEVKNGHISACQGSLALVGGNSVFNPDPSAMESCEDAAGEATGLPNVAAFAVDTNEMCSPVTIGVNARTEGCPVEPGTEREFTRVVGPMRWLAEEHPGLHGVYLANGDLPSTKLSAIPDIAAQEGAGITFDAKFVQGAQDAQSDYIPRLAPLKDGSNYVYNGSGDYVSLHMGREARAQGIDLAEVVWACGVACYTQNMLSGGAAVEGSYVWIQSLPFEEAGENEALDAYVGAVGEDDVDTWGVQSWAAAIAFKQAVDGIVAESGPNAITRAALLDALAGLEDFDGAGLTGARKLTEYSPCYVMVQVRDGAFERVHPEEPGTFDCDEANLVTVRVNPEQAAATDLR